ncbi:delta(9)-fatty-acid desaturase fat-6 [Sipha flava]|uniref:Acyl-CoA desaturase n=1 Tax=Sipha flava TaxID=143950 RepID=A0A2S2PZ41_9HEMI|nr:delta(9)-fatty-acid desaturase fat-6 [Sipha flava]
MANKDTKIPRETHWPSVLFYLYLHFSAFIGLYLGIFQVKWTTIFYTICLIYLSVLGLTAGAHRLWAHASFKANIFLRQFLAFAQTLICQGPIYEWAIEHRLHHEYFGTEKDPFNSSRGFWFTYFINKLVSSHPDNENLLKAINAKDLDQDPVVMWQKRLYWLLAPLLMIITVVLPSELWDESLFCSIFFVGFFRITVSLHYSWILNAATIIWGLEPLNKYSIQTNLVFIFNKSLWPQYHYILPWDYQCGEYGSYNNGCITAHIRVWAALRLVTDLRTIDTEGIRKAMIEAATTGQDFNECVEKYTFDPNLLKIKCELDLERIPC